VFGLLAVPLSRREFRTRDADVEAAATRNQLLLKYRDGGVVTAKIVRRVKPDEDAE
jgi:hypothetical protein